MLVKISYYPRWHATGATGPYRVSPNLMVVVPTAKDVSLVYGSTPAITLGNAHERRDRRRGARPCSSSRFGGGETCAGRLALVDTSAIFKAYDVRGTYPDQLDERVAEAVGSAFATFATSLARSSWRATCAPRA